jgi:hypothetical protein
MRVLTLVGGPLDGKTYRVPESATAFVHHAAHGGWYDLDGRWNADAVVTLLADTSKLAAALEAATVPGASIEGRGLEEFLPKGLPRVVAEARMGRRVMLVGHTVRAAREAFDEVLGLAYDAALDDMSVRRAKGNERASFESGGLIVPVGLNSRGARGLSADVLYLLPEVDKAAIADLLPALAASEVGLVLHHPDSNGADQ